ncbi:MAG: FecR family protein [Marinifilaceae bacterium]|jgi:hypothetical protein|nr:FecR family protein [Marinifilaceae bacterium]
MRKSIYNLIIKSILGEESQRDNQILSKWKRDESNSSLYDDIVNPKNIRKGLESLDYFQQNSRQKEFDKYISHRSFLTYFRYAAAFIIPIGLGLIFYFVINIRTEEAIVVENKYEPVQSDIKIIDNKGTVYSLSQKDSLIRTKNTEILLKNNQLLFKNIKNNQCNQHDCHTIITPKGKIYSFYLPDSSKVWLNAETSFSYPTSFTGKSRIVNLEEGEAYFEIKKDKTKAFIVKFNKQRKVKVLGTHFNIKSYSDCETDNVTLVEGRVEVSDSFGKLRIKPNQQLSWKSNEMIVRKINANQFIQWRDKKLVFRDVSLESIMIELQRYYDVKVFYLNQDVKKLRFSMNINQRDSFVRIVEMFESTDKIKFDLKEKTVIVSKK